MAKTKRIQQEEATLYKLIRLYCKGHHQKEKKGLCPECNSLFEYAIDRINNCTFGEDKPTCQNCPVHCYKPDIREEMRVIMRYSGPKMMYRHPLAAVHHFINKAIDKKKIK